MRIKSFSPKQLEVLTWWNPNSRHRDSEAIICDGAVRSGKTMCMGLSFVLWAMRRFDGGRFGLCGKTIVSLRRNLLDELLPTLRALGCGCRDQISKNRVTVTMGKRSNTFYLFGGKDEGSRELIQGVTLCGVLLDEVALMPRSFVEQAIARCSVEGARLWFNCNPESPEHWFYREWICRTEERRALYLHFSMEDNPSLSPEMLERYRRMYSGAFYRRFVLGEWVQAQGRVYDFFEPSMAVPVPEGEFSKWVVSCDYGTVNPASFGLWGYLGGVWYRVSEYYYDSRLHGAQRTDGEYVRELMKLIGNRRAEAVIVDPSAASFMELLRREGLNVVKARNDVLSGIRLTAELLRTGRLAICRCCADTLRELALYSWDPEQGDRPLKKNDHAMDDMRYFAQTWLSVDRGGFAALSVRRTPSNQGEWRNLLEK
ncbi:MAG: PBSX family phage terminase large subunit [Candidatus Heteroscillospira sp.]